MKEVKEAMSRRNGNKDMAPSFNSLASRLDKTFDEFKRSFDELLAPFQGFSTEDNGSRAPFVDVLDQGDHYTVTAELPGFSKEQVDIQVNKTGLVLKAEKKMDQEDKEASGVRRQSSRASFETSIAFPDEVVPNKVESSMKNGVLELSIPKREPRPEEKIRVKL
jgi:HSP20 family protein